MYINIIFFLSFFFFKVFSTPGHPKPIYSSSNLKTPSKLCSGSKSHDVQEVLKKKQVKTSSLLPVSSLVPVPYNKYLYICAAVEL